MQNRQQVAMNAAFGYLRFRLATNPSEAGRKKHRNLTAGFTFGSPGLNP
jgi:hypothetical protein